MLVHKLKVNIRESLYLQQYSTKRSYLEGALPVATVVLGVLVSYD